MAWEVRNDEDYWETLGKSLRAQYPGEVAMELAAWSSDAQAELLEARALEYFELLFGIVEETVW